jgi:hypothetical protein
VKKTSKGKSAKPVRKRRAPKKVTEVFEDCTITIQGDKIWISGPLADKVAEAARKAGMTFQEMFNHCIGTYLPQVVAELGEKPKPKIKIQELPPDYEYVRREYGATPKQATAAVKRALREIAADRKAGKLVTFTGSLTSENPRPKTAKKYPAMITDREGGLPLSDELARYMGANIGDEFAAWKEGDDIILIFTKNYHGKRKIPKHAHRGVVEPALLEKSECAAKKAESANVKKPKTIRAKADDEMI